MADPLRDAEASFNAGLGLLRSAADILRSDAVPASEETMATERALSRAIDVLTATGFRRPGSR